MSLKCSIRSDSRPGKETKKTLPPGFANLTGEKSSCKHRRNHSSTTTSVSISSSTLKLFSIFSTTASSVRL